MSKLTNNINVQTKIMNSVYEFVNTIYTAREKMYMRKQSRGAQRRRVPTYYANGIFIFHFFSFLSLAKTLMLRGNCRRLDFSYCCCQLLFFFSFVYLLQIMSLTAISRVFRFDKEFTVVSELNSHALMINSSYLLT